MSYLPMWWELQHEELYGCQVNAHPFHTPELQARGECHLKVKPCHHRHHFSSAMWYRVTFNIGFIEVFLESRSIQLIFFQTAVLGQRDSDPWQMSCEGLLVHVPQWLSKQTGNSSASVMEFELPVLHCPCALHYKSSIRAHILRTYTCYMHGTIFTIFLFKMLNLWLICLDYRIFVP